MKRIICAVSALVAFSAFANLHQAPPHLTLDTNKGVFVDFLSANVSIIYDVEKKEAIAETTIKFNQTETGKAIFDLIPTPISIELNGELINSKTTRMNGVSTVRYLDKVTPAGLYTLKIKNTISTNISWSYGAYVKSAFWMSDLSDRQYLEQYLPSNLEYDQYQTQLDLRVINTEIDHVLYTNGQVSEVSKNHWSIIYPEVYTASSYFLHLTKEGLIPEQKSTYRSIDGRDIPVVVYTTQSTSRFMNETLKVLAELEADYGPWPHQQVIIYGAGQGGMEHCGATITSFSALGHELTHSYFARGIMPANGNAGWVDEAIASWRDAGYPSYASRSLSRTDMAGHSVYQRTTDRDAYTKGMRFIGHLHDRFKERESFKTFLKSFFSERKFKPFKTHEFKEAVEVFYNTSLDDLFDRYIYGNKGMDVPEIKETKENPYHPQLSEKELLDLL